MLQALLMLAAEEAEQQRGPVLTSPAALFAAWAIVVGVIGHARPSRSRERAERRAHVIAVSVVLMVAAMATAVITA